jgi:chromosome segregation ATPase
VAADERERALILQIGNLTSQVEGLSLECDSLRSDSKDLLKLKSEVASLKLSLVDSDELQHTLVSAGERESALQNQIAELSSRIETLSRENDSLLIESKELFELKNEVASLHAEIENLRHTVTVFEERTLTSENQVLELTSRIHRLADENVSLTELSEVLDTLKKELAETHTQNEILGKEVGLKNDRISELIAAKTQSEAKVSEISNQMYNAKKNSDITENQMTIISDLKAKIREMEANLAHQTELVDIYRVNLVEVVMDRDRLKSFL